MTWRRPQTLIASATCVLLLAMIAACASTQPPLGPLAAAVPAPVYRTGDTWTYAARNSFNDEPLGLWRYTVASAANGEIHIAIARGAAAEPEIEIASAPGEFRLHALTNLTAYRFEAPFVALNFPLTPGRSWRHTMPAFNTAAQRAQTVTVIGWVEGWERVHVPAGDFDAIRIERVAYAGDGDYVRTQTETYEREWYAPEIGAIVKREERSQWKALNMRSRPIIHGDRTTLELTSVERSAR